MSRPSFESIFLRHAFAIAERSTCKRLHVGCVITTTDFQRTLAIGYNGNARGFANTCDTDEPGACGCFVEGTSVSASQVSRAYRRRYVGEVVRIVTAASEFTATSNHPVLTLGRGWVPAQLLHEGDHLLGATGDQCVSSGAPHDYDDVSIEQVFESVRVAGRMIRRAGTRHDFHGDALVGQEIDVVTTDGCLSANRDPVLLEHGREPRLPTSLVVPAPFGSPGQVAALFVGLHAGHEAGLHESVADHDDAHAVRASERDGGRASRVGVDDLTHWKRDHRLALMPAEVLGHLSQDTRFAEALLNSRVGEAEARRDRDDVLASRVAANKVCAVEKKAWSGHVYNLQTASNWFAVSHERNVVHNCIHAEANAIIKCGAPHDEKVVFVTDSPCPVCAKFIIQLGGVVRVVFVREYRRPEGLLILGRAGIEVERVDVLPALEVEWPA